MADARWTFFRAGGFDQVKLGSGEDLRNLDQLDQKLWVALACPTSGLEIDPRTLSLIDTDGDGRVRAPELIAAAKFACEHLQNADDLLAGRSELPLASINDETEAGKTLLSSARQVLVNLGKKADTAISADDLTDPVRIFADTPFNGDGVITELSTKDEFARSVLRDIVECFGSEMDRSGQAGVTSEKVDTFFAELEAYVRWQAAADEDPAILPLQRDKTAAAASALAAVRVKVDDFFARTRLATFDARLVPILNRKEEEYLDVVARDLSSNATELSGFPLAQVGAGRSLPLLSGVNPAHRAAIAELREAAVLPLLGPKDQLTEGDWAALTQRLAAYEAWQSAKQGVQVEKLGFERIRAIVTSDAHQTLTDLIAKDKALEAEAASIENVERLVRYHRDLYRLCTNFVNFQDFYDGGDLAVFQCGVLYLDQRTCKLCLRVEDPAKHATMAGLAGAYLVYADCSRPSGEKMHIVAAFTNGDSDHLMVGKNGLFYDRKGRDWDATVTKIIDNPIGIRQAFFAPYKKLVRLIEEQVAKRAAASNNESNAMLSSAATSAVNTDKAAASPPDPKKIDVGSVAALGVAVGALGAFLTAMVGYATGILKMGILPTIAAILGIIILISSPSVVLAYLTLRKRNLGPILDANGWAINANALINVSFGAALTSLPRLPPGSRRDFRDRYVDKGIPWKRWAFLGLFLLLGYKYWEGAFDHFLPQHLHSSHVFGRFAPQKAQPPVVSASTPAASRKNRS